MYARGVHFHHRQAGAKAPILTCYELEFDANRPHVDVLDFFTFSFL